MGPATASAAAPFFETRRRPAGALARIPLRNDFVERRSPTKRPRFGALDPAGNRAISPVERHRDNPAIACSRKPASGHGSVDRRLSLCLGTSLSHDIRRGFRRRWAVTLLVPALGCALAGAARADAPQALVQGAVPPATASPAATPVAQTPAPPTAAPAVAQAPQAPASAAAATHAAPAT